MSGEGSCSVQRSGGHAFLRGVCVFSHSTAAAAAAAAAAPGCGGGGAGATGRVDRPAAAVTRNTDDNSPQRTSHDHG